MRRNSKTRIFVGILVIGILLIRGWVIPWHKNRKPKEIPIASAVSNNLRMTIKLDKALYKVEETVKIKIIFTNLGKEDIFLGLRTFPAPDWLLNIHDEQNKKCRTIVLIYYKLKRFGRESFHLIKPKEDYEVKLTCKIERARFSFSKEFYKMCSQKRYFKKGDFILNTKDHAFVLGRTGSFYITAKYDSRSWVKLAREIEIENVFVGTLITSPITIKIR